MWLTWPVYDDSVHHTYLTASVSTTQPNMNSGDLQGGHDTNIAEDLRMFEDLDWIFIFQKPILNDDIIDSNHHLKPKRRALKKYFLS